RDLAARDARQIFLFLLFRSEQKQRLRNTDRLMRRNKRSHVSIPAPKQNCGASVVGLRQTKAAIFLWNFDSKRPDLCEPFEIFGRNFAGAIDFVRTDMFAQVTFQLLQEILARDAVLCTLRGVRVNPIEIVTSDEQIAGETAAVL